ncbi:MAG: prephenate dehydrogenase/arogenate dehydrogenase family protein, partial [Pseudomonadota bacterium]|nr:prephenate dehydrogenase/arogenate dehydrogenase family protein [Pseudomonadota bacterium]MEC8664699.1 prephenate dehydrogenase/arogenate dehydrogenase family protein [Pseudomonadota bacterium]
MLFNKVTIIGLGLIGSSIARIIKQKNLAKTLVAVDASKAVCDKVMELGIADEATREIRNGVADADLVILAVPVGACGAVAEQIRYALKDGAIVTDTGSVKGTVVEQVMPHLKDNVHFVPAHPIAGT